MATDRIKVSQLPLIKAASLSTNDVFIINDNDRGDGQTITSGIKYSDVIASFSQQDIVFTGDIVFRGDVLFDGTISPSPGKELNITLDNLTINDSITIHPNADISGINLSDLDDTVIVSQAGNQLLIWDEGEVAWRNFTLQQIIDNVPELNFENVNDIKMSGDLDIGGDLTVKGSISGIGLNDLDDVRTPLPIGNRQYLRWDNYTQLWVASDIDIHDVVGGIVNPPSDGSVYGRALVDGIYDWVKAAPIESPAFEGTPICFTPQASDSALSIVNKQYVADVLTNRIGGISLDTLDDVVVPLPSNRDTLIFDQESGYWISGQPELPLVTLDDLEDVQVLDPGDGETLVFDLSSGYWLPGIPTISLDELEDVNSSNPIDGQSLIWNEGIQSWVPGSPSIPDVPSDGGSILQESGDDILGDGVGDFGEIDKILFDSDGGIPTMSLDDLEDVDSSNPIDGQSLIWNEATKSWVPGTPSTPIGGGLILQESGDDILGDGVGDFGEIDKILFDSVETSVLSINGQTGHIQTTEQWIMANGFITPSEVQRLMQPLIDRIQRLEQLEKLLLG